MFFSVKGWLGNPKFARAVSAFIEACTQLSRSSSVTATVSDGGVSAGSGGGHHAVRVRGHNKRGPAQPVGKRRTFCRDDPRRRHDPYVPDMTGLGDQRLEHHNAEALAGFVVGVGSATFTVGGEERSFQLIDVCRLRDGRLAERWAMFDRPREAERNFADLAAQAASA